MSDARVAGTSLYQIARELADSGRCRDFWDIEMELLALGHSAAAAHRATADAETRQALDERCARATRGARRQTSSDGALA